MVLRLPDSECLAEDWECCTPALCLSKCAWLAWLHLRRKLSDLLAQSHVRQCQHVCHQSWWSATSASSEACSSNTWLRCPIHMQVCQVCRLISLTRPFLAVVQPTVAPASNNTAFCITKNSQTNDDSVHAGEGCEPLTLAPPNGTLHHRRAQAMCGTTHYLVIAAGRPFVYISIANTNSLHLLACFLLHDCDSWDAC